ncbi:MAG: T9SS type A sorting domain-containing protein [Ginsengibacter sp.]
MEKKFTFITRLLFVLAVTIITTFITGTSYGQIDCPNRRTLYSEDFGDGTTSTPHPDVIPSGLTYQDMGSLTAEGVYRIINNTQQKPEWHASADHTGNQNGRMLVANGLAEVFYNHVISNPAGFTDGNYTLSVFAMNVNTPGTCTYPLLSALTYSIQYLNASGNWIHLLGSPYTAPALPQVPSPTWIAQGSIFTLPATGGVLPTSLRIIISDGTKGGCGNDFAIDDINISQCLDQNNPTPVTFMGVNARQQGGGVSVNWSTSQELNSSFFDLEKSVDGTSSWSFVSTVKGAGNSSVVKKYGAFDAKPFSGYNFYRIKQVDIDGKFKYSKTVSIKVDASTTNISVLANPFHNNLTVDLFSPVDEVLTARMIDIMGKPVSVEKWNVTKGNTRKDFSNVNGLQQGMYILTVTNNAGKILYNGKVIKQ